METRQCKLCGKPIPKGRRTYCSRECMMDITKKKIRKKERESFKKPQAVKRSYRRLGNDLDDVARRAREAGMTYGQYVGKEYAKAHPCKRKD